MIDNSRTYSKLLIAGEYLVLDGASALAVPLTIYSGTWEYGDNINNDLLKISQYFTTLSIDFNKTQFKADINNGIYFKSSIPMGYGVGSSGALVAAMYKKYGNYEKSHHYIYKTLGKIESFFHGKSSGIDPIVSYYGNAINFKNGEIIQLESLQLKNLYLYDTGMTRNTEKLVSIFREKLKDISYRNSLTDLKLINDQLVDSLINKSNNIASLWEAISDLQLTLFDFAIPSEVRKEWIKRKAKGQYFKLCGAGGGGFFLVYSRVHEPQLIKL